MNSYEAEPENAFWRSAIGTHSMYDIQGLRIPKSKEWITNSSCFAQHLTYVVVSDDLSCHNHETAFAGAYSEIAVDHNYGVYSARTRRKSINRLQYQWTKSAMAKKEHAREIRQLDKLRIDPSRPVPPNYAGNEIHSALPVLKIPE